MGWGGNFFPLLIVTASGTFTGFFEYAPAPGFGNLIQSIVPLPVGHALNVPVFTDPFGNAVLPGNVSYSVAGTVIATQQIQGSYNLLTAAGAGQLTPWTSIGGMGTDGTAVQISGTGNPASVIGIQMSSFGTGITADGLFLGGQTVFIPTGSTETYTNTTLATSTNLQMTGLILGATYQFDLSVIYAGAATNGGLKWSVSTDGHGTATMTYQGTTGVQETLADQFPLSGHAAQTGGVGIGNGQGLTIHGGLKLDGASTSVAMQFAQNAASATATTLFGGTFMRLWRIA